MAEPTNDENQSGSSSGQAPPPPQGGSAISRLWVSTFNLILPSLHHVPNSWQDCKTIYIRLLLRRMYGDFVKEVI